MWLLRKAKILQKNLELHKNSSPMRFGETALKKFFENKILKNLKSSSLIFSNLTFTIFFEEFVPKSEQKKSLFRVCSGSIPLLYLSFLSFLNKEQRIVYRDAKLGRLGGIRE